MAANQKHETTIFIRSTAELIVKNEGSKGHNNETYEKRIQDVVVLLTSLCEMYRIAHL